MQSLDVQEICEKILDALFSCMRRIDSATIILLDRRTGELKKVTARSRDSRGKIDLQYSRTIVNRVIREGRAIIMSDTSLEDEVNLSESIEIMRIKSIMCVPLVSKSGSHGVIYLHSVNVPQGFRQDDLFLLTGLSSPTALALENALLYSKTKEAEKDLQKARDRLEERVELRTRELSKINLQLKQEVKERQQAERALKETNAFLTDILESSSSISIISTDLDQRILFWNRGAEQIFGYKAEEMEGRRGVEILYPDDDTRKKIEKIRQTLEKEKRAVTTELKEVSKDGRILWMRLNLTPRFDERGRVVGILGIGEDISEKKKLEEQLKRGQKLEALGTLTGGVAHNFRNILSAISLESQLARLKYGNSPEILEIADRIEKSIEKGALLINSLVQFSRKKPDREFEVINLAEVVHDTYQLISKSFDKKIDIRTDLPPLLPITGDHSSMSQVLMNLCNNARDAMPRGGELKIEAKRDGEEALVLITDTGQGMDQETLEKCFDPFFTTKEVDKGTGLGLSTTYGIVKDHGGRIFVESEPNRGTIFRLYFPLTTSERKSKTQATKKIQKGKGERILVIDDEKEMLGTMESLLEQLGYRAASTSRPADAIDIYRSWKPDAVLVDRNMPEMDGITCASRIRELDHRAKIVIISGYDEKGPEGIDEQTVKMIQGYMTKPVQVEELCYLLNGLFHSE
jgi:PAS domain S-box-containing protein